VCQAVLLPAVSRARRAEVQEHRIIICKVIQKRIRRGKGASTSGMRKCELVEHDMPGCDNFVSLEIKTTVALVIGGVAEKDALGGSWRKFVRSGSL